MAPWWLISNLHSNHLSWLLPKIPPPKWLLSFPSSLTLIPDVSLPIQVSCGSIKLFSPPHLCFLDPFHIISLVKYLILKISRPNSASHSSWQTSHPSTVALFVHNLTEKALGLTNAAMTRSKPGLATFGHNFKIELVPPIPAEIPITT